MTFDIDKKFSLLFEVAKTICAAYTGFSTSEIHYCQQKINWQKLKSVLMSNDTYEALINLNLSPMNDVVSYCQFFICCMIQFPDEEENIRLSNLLDMIDNHNELDDVLKNKKTLKMLLAISAKHKESSKSDMFMLYHNGKRILAHILKKFPDMLKLNVFKTKTTPRKFKFKPEEIQFYL